MQVALYVREREHNAEKLRTPPSRQALKRLQTCYSPWKKPRNSNTSHQQSGGTDSRENQRPGCRLRLAPDEGSSERSEASRHSTQVGVRAWDRPLLALTASRKAYPAVPSSLALTGKPRCSPWLLTSVWPSPHSAGCLGKEPIGGRHLSFTCSLCLPNKQVRCF